MIGTSDQSCWLAEACKILLLLCMDTHMCVRDHSKQADLVCISLPSREDRMVDVASLLNCLMPHGPSLGLMHLTWNQHAVSTQR